MSWRPQFSPEPVILYIWKPRRLLGYNFCFMNFSGKCIRGVVKCSQSVLRFWLTKCAPKLDRCTNMKTRSVDLRRVLLPFSREMYVGGVTDSGSEGIECIRKWAQFLGYISPKFRSWLRNELEAAIFIGARYTLYMENSPTPRLQLWFSKHFWQMYSRCSKM